MAIIKGTDFTSVSGRDVARQHPDAAAAWDDIGRAEETGFALRSGELYAFVDSATYDTDVYVWDGQVWNAVGHDATVSVDDDDAPVDADQVAYYRLDEAVALRLLVREELRRLA